MAPQGSQGISRIELAIFCRQFSAMLLAGVDAFRGIEVLRRQADNPQLAAILETIAQDLSLGRSLSHAFTRYPRYFSPLFISLVRQGEREGILGEVMLKLAEYLEREALATAMVPEPAAARWDWEALVEQLRPLVTWSALVIGAILVMVAGLWYATLAGLLPLAYLGPNIVLLVGAMMLVFTLLFLRYRPPRLVRCNFCGRPENVAGPLIPGEGVWICADCVRRSVQILREHQAAVADQPLDSDATPAFRGEPTPTEELPQDERLWRPRGRTVYLSDALPEEERIRILPPDDDQ